jgi:hypothetical protein
MDAADLRELVSGLQADHENGDSPGRRLCRACVESRAWWGGPWAGRVEQSSFAEQAIQYGLSDRAELGAIAAVWRRWAERPDAYFAVLHAEVLARRA